MPKSFFLIDMEVLLELCFLQGERVILCTGSNDDMSRVKISTMLKNKFSMRDAVKSITNRE